MKTKENQKRRNDGKPGDMGENAKTALMEFAALAGLTKTRDVEEPAAPVAAPEPICAEEEKLQPPTVDFPTPAVPVCPVVRLPETSVIAQGVVVEGSLSAAGDLDCQGEVKGELMAKGAIVMSGKQTGNLRGQRISFSHARIEGNVRAEEDIEIDSDTQITGDIHGGSVVLDGRVTGTICAEGLVCLRKNAVLDGDIQAGALAIEQGAQLAGKVTMKLTESR